MLGGTLDARRLAAALTEGALDAVYSIAGRTEASIPVPLPLRIGGFGGATGLADFIRTENISHVVDATHPFAARISANAVAACAATGTPLIALERAAWDGTGCIHVPDIKGAVAALPDRPTRVFLAIGRQNLDAFAGLPHHWVLRLIDPAPQPLAGAEVIVSRGPFTTEDDTALMQSRNIQIVVAKNAGGSGARAKLDAARVLGIPVILIARPYIPPRRTLHRVRDVMDWLHATPRGV